MAVVIWWCLVLITVTVNAGQYCVDLEEKLKDEVPVRQREAYSQGRPVPIVVKWDGRAAARASASLLAALIGRGLRFKRVRLEKSPPEPLDRALLSNHSMYDVYDYLEMWPSATVPIASKHRYYSCAPERLCTTRLSVVGQGAALAPITLFFRQTVFDLECIGAHAWPFYSNQTALRNCGFLGSDSKTAIVYYPIEYQHIADDLIQRAKYHGLLWSMKAVNNGTESRRKFYQLLRNATRSFLFLEQEVWSTAPHVFSCQPPPCINVTTLTSSRVVWQTCLDPVYTVRLANAFALDLYHPNILNLFLNFAPTPEEIREILEIEADLNDIGEEAACAWSLKHIDRFRSWFVQDITPTYWIAVFMCKNEPDNYDKVVMEVSDLIVDSKIEIQRYDLENCSNEFNMKNMIANSNNYRQFRTLLGYVGRGEGSRNAAAHAQDSEVALVLYDSVTEDYIGNSVTRGVGGTSSQLAAAVTRLVSSCGWARMAVISEVSTLAKGIYESLDNTTLILRNIEIQRPKVKKYLEELKEDNARIFYVNTDAETSTVVLCKAMELGMTYDEGYVWLVREWRAQIYNCSGVDENTRRAMRHYTVSPWWRGHELAKKQNLSTADVNFKVRERLQGMWDPGLWPPLAASLVDSLLLLTHASKAFINKHWTRSSDLHGSGSVKLLWSSLDKPIPGVTGKLNPNKLQDPVIYIDEWRGGRAEPRSLDVWRSTEDDVSVGAICPEPISDGGKKCVTMRWYGPGDKFTWRCHDWLTLVVTVVLVVSIPALVVARRARLARLKRSERMLKAKLSAKGIRTANEIGSQLVDRALLELRHEVGAGRFGRVRLAVLRPRDRTAIAVAAKTLPDDATPSEERDFLREACVMASLDHSHIVRLIGVCATDGPLMVLMEYAFFGDLGEYLRSRRHLAENIGEDNIEAEHVSAVNLTRLGSEAASALAYLASKRLVHRDVRAANCLVDAKRSLKLADFGMARKVDASSSEYLCQRRGYFPVLCMAPESLDQGVFSPASDVWALGILFFELITLGERPYGKWVPLRVMRFVEGGGYPPLPPDTTYITRNVLLACWRHSPRRRVSARQLHQYLRVRRSALTPALLPPRETDLPLGPAPSVLSIDMFKSDTDFSTTTV